MNFGTNHPQPFISQSLGRGRSDLTKILHFLYIFDDEFNLEVWGPGVGLFINLGFLLNKKVESVQQK